MKAGRHCFPVDGDRYLEAEAIEAEPEEDSETADDWQGPRAAETHFGGQAYV